LRKAFGLLDKSLTGLDAQKQEEVVQAGIAELRACLDLIQASDRPADHEQLPGIQAALTILAPEEPAADLPAPRLLVEPSSAPPGRTAGASPPGRSRRKRRAATSPVPDSRAVETQLLGLNARLHFLHVALNEPLSRLADAIAAQSELHRQVQALCWLGDERLPDILRAIDSTTDAEARLAAGGALALMGVERGMEWLFAILEKATSGKRPLPGLAPTLLATLANSNQLDGMLRAFSKPAGPFVCGALLPLLAQHGCLPPERLWELVNHASDEVAIPAAHALAWTSASHDTPLLLGWVGKARTARRANALLFAAVGLGSTAALSEVRSRLKEGADAQLIDALAVAGDRTDAAMLVDLAIRPEVDADHALLAAAHLGNVEILPRLPSLAELVAPEILREASREIAGSSRSDGEHQVQMDHDVRALRGKPWSLAGVLACLAAADEPIFAQQRLALELRVRTGLTLPVPLPSLASKESRSSALLSLEAHFAKPASRFKAGAWYYQGKPSAAQGAPS